MTHTLASYISAVKAGTIDPATYLAETLEKAQTLNEQYNAFVRFHPEIVESFKLQTSSFKPVWLCGAPIAIKDNILTAGYVASSGSKMLEDYISPYDATCYRNLVSNGGVMIGHANCDEFSMGSSGENSAFWPAINPHGVNRVPGGTSSGPAVAVASGMVLGALGTDTGWSVRQPASFCGIVWLKPTYGAVSRYGVTAMASSFDQVGVLTQTVSDAQILFGAIKWYDPQDSTSVGHHRDTRPLSLQWLRIGVPKQYMGEGLDPRIKSLFLESIEKMKTQWAIIVDIDMPLLDTALAVYYILVPSEVSGNMARYDGIRYGLSSDTTGYESHAAYIGAMRAAGFGDEVVRRILLGAHILSAAEYEWLFVKAMDLRTIVTQQMIDHFAQDVDVIMGPTSPILPWKIGEKVNDPLAMYLADIYTIVVNICGIPAISLPIGFASDGDEKLPVWLQIMGKHRSEYQLLSVAQEIEALCRS